MKKVLIVGGAGYIGGFLTDLLVEEEYEVDVYDSLLFEDRFLKDVNFISGDVRNRAKLESIVHDYDTVVWLAAVVGDAACAVNEELTESVNYDSVKWLVDSYKGKIVFASTCSVYGINNDLLDENSSTNPLSLYAETKLRAEKYIIENYDNYLIFRLGTLFGIGDFSSRLRLDLVVNILTMRAAQGDLLPVFGGDQWRPLLHVRDVGHAIHHGIENGIVGLYNLSYKNYRIKDIAEEISKIVGDVEIKYTDLKYEDLRNYRITECKYSKTGWSPTLDLAAGVKEISRVIREKRIKNTENVMYSNAKYMEALNDLRHGVWNLEDEITRV